MTRWFNIAGPCKDDIHYMLSPTVRLPDLEDLIQQRSYFVLHAPRQTGKTTAMLALSKQLTATGNYAAVMVSVEVGSAFNHDPSAAELAILGAWYNTINIRLPKELQPPVKQWQQEEPGNRIKAFLQGWAKAINRPIVLFIDEIDSLQDQTLISVLRQLRDGFPNRPENFPSKEILIARQDTHLDSLAERLREPRIKAIIEPMLAGLELGNIPNDDIQFVIDLGLCKMHPYGGLTIANPIYREVLPRALTVTPMASLPMIAPTWLTPEGELNLDALLTAFLKFWRQHGEPLLGSTGYHEIAPHIVLMAFLHRVINGGGVLEREYAIGSDRMDLCLQYKDVILGIELKVWRDKKRNPQADGIEQLESYLGRLGLDFGWLFIFDRRKNALPMEERLSTEVVVTENQYRITVIRA